MHTEEDLRYALELHLRYYGIERTYTVIQQWLTRNQDLLMLESLHKAAATCPDRNSHTDTPTWWSITGQETSHGSMSTSVKARNIWHAIAQFRAGNTTDYDVDNETGDFAPFTINISRDK